jgi:hypothetical protein
VWLPPPLGGQGLLWVPPVVKRPPLSPKVAKEGEVAKRITEVAVARYDRFIVFELLYWFIFFSVDGFYKSKPLLGRKKPSIEKITGLR